MAGPLNATGVRNTLLNQGKKVTELDTDFWENVTKELKDSPRSTLTVERRRRPALPLVESSLTSFFSSSLFFLFFFDYI
jgi:hypothetical protein